MVDIVDRAQEAEEMHRSRALDRLHGEIAAGRILETAKNCSECGAMIPSARQAALPGVQRCVDCAERLEAERGRRRAI